MDRPSKHLCRHHGLPGQESGNSLVDVLFGDVNPSVKLIYTIAKKETDYGTEIVYKSDKKPAQVGFVLEFR